MDPILRFSKFLEPVVIDILPIGARERTLRAYFRFFGGCDCSRYSSPIIKSGGYTVPSPHIPSPSLLLIQILCHGLMNIAIPHGSPRAEPGSAFPFHYCITSGILTLFSDRRMRQRSCHTPHLRDLTTLYALSQQLSFRASPASLTLGWGPPVMSIAFPVPLGSYLSHAFSVHLLIPSRHSSPSLTGISCDKYHHFYPFHLFCATGRIWDNVPGAHTHLEAIQPLVSIRCHSAIFWDSVCGTYCGSRLFSYFFMGQDIHWDNVGVPSYFCTLLSEYFCLLWDTVGGAYTTPLMAAGFLKRISRAYFFLFYHYGTATLGRIYWILRHRTWGTQLCLPQTTYISWDSVGGPDLSSFGISETT